MGDRDRITIYPAGAAREVTVLWLSDARVVEGGDTFTVEFPLPEGAKPMMLGALLVRYDELGSREVYAGAGGTQERPRGR